MKKETFTNRSPIGSTKHETMTFIRPTLDIDQFDLLWKDFFNSTPHFSDITQKISHPTDIYETAEGIAIHVAAVGLEKSDIEISTEGDILRIKYQKPQEKDINEILYKGIKKSSFDLALKISPKFDLPLVTASMDKGLLVLSIPYAESQAPKKIQIK